MPQLLLEIAHIRNVMAVEIKQKRLVKEGDGTKRFVMFDEVQLRSNIMGALCPTSNPSLLSIEELLLPFVEAPDSHEHNGRRVRKRFDDGDYYEGTVCESFGVLAKCIHHIKVYIYIFLIPIIPPVTLKDPPPPSPPSLPFDPHFSTTTVTLKMIMTTSLSAFL